MPTTTSSSRRKASRREPTSDIDESPPTNTRRSVDEDVEDDEVQSRRPNRKNVKKKGKNRAVVPPDDNADEVEDDDEEDEDEDPIDVENFPDQPLLRAHVERLHAFSTDWQSVANTIKTSEGAMEGIALALSEATDGDAVDKELLQVETTLKSLIDVEMEMQLHKELLKDLAQVVATEDVVDIMERYDKGVKGLKRKYEEMTTRQKYAKNAVYKEFKESLYSVDHPGEAMPPITDFIAQEPGDEEDDDDELEIGGVTQDFKCPLTLRTLEDPITSATCGHSFSQDALRQLFSNQQSAKKCPAAGCNRSFRFQDCKPDRALAQRMRIFAKRQKEKSQVSSEEIIS
ncbi:hypothetical protein E1B28_012482 [Marasmius oreades]|uniref:SP-RING-type domain-containing protein n=1 Tax=Marasmius oreades TaxID=181124 RepID=A0A9P7RRM3_9AGAR|nr:uncharacterized protein E1B28_012482 [Marasmius oreades]KAG7088494.1 hypothetical protein E1B28_012482 [Marasmius oreades]